MGYIRTTQRPALDRAALAATVARFIGEKEIAEVMAAQDPFRIDHDCLNPLGHEAIASCGEVVCAHCARIFWR